MAELEKINRIINRELPDSDKEVLLVLDATTGQNAVNQTKEFKNAAGITGIVLTKLDGTAKGGVILAIKEELNVPVKYIGVGEQIDDLQPFEPDEFARALFGAEEIAEMEETKETEETAPAEEEFKPATAEIWEQIDAEAEAEKLAEEEKEKAKTEEEILAEEQAKAALELEKAEEKKRRAEERKNRAKKYNWSTEQTATTTADDDWFEQWKKGEIKEE